MADLYKIQYANNTLTYPGWNGFLQYENPMVGYPITYLSDDHVSVTGDAIYIPGQSGITLDSGYDPYYRISGYEIDNGEIVDGVLIPSGPCTIRAVEKVNNFFASGRFTHIANPTAAGNRTVKSDFYAYKTYTSGNASIPAEFYVTKTSYQSGNKIGNKTASTTNAWNPTGTISAYEWSGYCDTDAYQKFALSQNYLTTRSHRLVVGSTNFGSTGGTVAGTTKGSTKLTNWGSTTTLGQVHCTAQLTTTNAYDYWMTNQSYTTANSIWWASGYLP